MVLKGNKGGIPDWCGGLPYVPGISRLCLLVVEARTVADCVDVVLRSAQRGYVVYCLYERLAAGADGTRCQHRL